MKIALINPSYLSDERQIVKQNEPVSIQYLKSYLNQHSYSCDCYDFCINDKKNIVIHIAENYDVVGISVFYPYNPLTLANEIKVLNPKVVIIIGGPGAKLDYRRYIYENSPIEYIIFNEGEDKLKTIIDYLNGKVSQSELYGVAYRKNGDIVVRKSNRNLNISYIDFPRRTQEEIAFYIPSIVSSRGCNGKCVFCSNSYMGKWRGRDYQDVVNEVEHLNKEREQRYFQFIEPNFLGDIKRGLEIAQEILRRGLKVSFDFSSRIDSLINGKNTLLQLKKAGASRVLLGVESFYDSTLSLWRKEITSNNILESIDYLNEIRLPFTISLILFHESVTMEELSYNIKVIDKTNTEDMIDNLFNKMIFYPGTALNRTSEIIPWEYKSNEIKKIYERCVIYRNSQEDLRKKILLFKDNLNSFDKIDDFILQNLYHFQNIKAKEFSMLKYLTGICYCKEDSMLLMYQGYAPNKIKFKLNPNIVIEEIEEETAIFTNVRTGISYYTNKTSYLMFILIRNSTYRELRKKVKYYLGEMTPNEYYKIMSTLFHLLYLDIIIIDTLCTG